MERISREHVIYEMNKENEPVLTVESGTTVVFETQDCFSGEVQSEKDTVSDIDFSKVNPATGPLYVEGAEIGDTLKVTLNRMEIDNKGSVLTAPGLGMLADGIEKEETAMGEISEEGTLYKGFNIPLTKMVGVIGTAPAGEGVNTGTPHNHGGNLDTTLLTEGATLYLPVNTPGALLAMGDMHASMADGEIMGSGMEVAGEIEVTVEVIKDSKLPLPFVETDEVYATLASRETMEEATKAAINNMVDVLMDKTDLTFNQAGMFLSLAGDLKVSQVVNPNKTMRVEVKKSVLNK
ncbi:MAG TPA: acetamidase/formamidase family protein [Atopostipes sp.]|nr:acetamidase/formamidase family protein [Atopostipes sp.]